MAAAILKQQRLVWQARSLLSIPRKFLPIQTRLYSQQNDKTEESEPDKKRSEWTSLQHIDQHFEHVPRENRDKASFMAAIEHFKQKSKNERGHVEFIISALRHMKEYNLHKDLDVYKALLRIFPASLRPTNVYQKVFMHYPHQQVCAVKVMDEMEWNLVQPDLEMLEIVKKTFGDYSHATKKARRMLYWYPRFRYNNKYLDRQLQDQRHMNLTFIQLAKMGLEMISRDKGSKITYATVTDDKSMIISSQSPLQRKLITQMDPAKSCFYVDGPFLLYVAENKLQYVTFTSDPGPNSERLLDKFLSHAEVEDLYAKKLYDGPEEDGKVENGTIHEQVDQTILALGVFEKNNENSASAWVNHLQKENPMLKKSTVILRINDQGENADQTRMNQTTENEHEEQKEESN